MENILVIGAGLSGLYAADLLKEKYDVTLLEARDRTGGRVLTQEGHDLGPSWIWPHHTHMAALVRSRGLELFRQYDEGAALYQVPGRTERFMPPPSPPAARVKGGLSRLTQRLASGLDGVTLRLRTTVRKISCKGGTFTVETDRGTFHAGRIVVAMPPRIALNIDFEPPLPEHVQSALQSVPTWMGHSRKCVVAYEKPFWRERGLSGFVFSQTGPMGEVHDASTEDEAALFGFLSPHAPEGDLETAVVGQLVELFGEDAAHYRGFYIHDWRRDRLTSTKADHALRDHPRYGHDVSAFEGRLHFLSTEAAYDEGGYLEGALNAAKTLAQRLWYCNG